MNPASFTGGEVNSCFAVAATISSNAGDSNSNQKTTTPTSPSQSTTAVATTQSFDRGVTQRLNHNSCAVAATQNSRIIIQHQQQQQQQQQRFSIAATTQNAYFGPFAAVNNNQQQSDNQSTTSSRFDGMTFTQNMQAGLNSYNFLFNSMPGQLSGTVNNLGVCLDLQFPEPNQIDFQYLQRIQQDSQWEKFYQECFQQKQGTLK